MVTTETRGIAKEGAEGESHWVCWVIGHDYLIHIKVEYNGYQASSVAVCRRCGDIAMSSTFSTAANMEEDDDL